MGSYTHTLKFYFVFADTSLFPVLQVIETAFQYITGLPIAVTVTKASLLDQWMWTSFLIQTEDNAKAWCSSAP